MRRPEQSIRDRMFELLSYNPYTGHFTWLVNTRNGKGRKGARAGRINNEGYWNLSIDGTSVKAHRLAWMFVHGEWPSADIDHINGDRLDNRISNLRQATRSTNSANRRRHQNNKSGFKGVHFHPKTRKWRAMICRDYQVTHLGLFETAELAHAAYCLAAQTAFGEFWRPE